MNNMQITANKNSIAPAGSFTKRIGNTTYIVDVYFNNSSKETFQDKVKRMIIKDLKTGNF